MFKLGRIHVKPSENAYKSEEMSADCYLRQGLGNTIPVYNIGKIIPAMYSNILQGIHGTNVV